jgi:DNA uptake protein ComE-like DNA-binding protein
MADSTKKTYELKLKDTSFYDDETGLSVTRDEKVEIGMGAGRKTLLMIKKGGLIEVKGPAAPPTGAGEKADDGPGGDSLPEDFPGLKALGEAGIKTRAQVEALSQEELLGTPGIGQKTAEEIQAALKKRANK